MRYMNVEWSCHFPCTKDRSSVTMINVGNCRSDGGCPSKNILEIAVVMAVALIKIGMNNFVRLYVLLSYKFC